MFSTFLLVAACNAPPSPSGAPTRTGDDAPVEEIGPDGDAPIDGAAVLFADGVVHDIEIGLGATAWNALQADWKTTVGATVTIDGEALEAGIHRKGSSTLRDMHGKASFAIDFGQFDSERTFHGVRRICLNNMVMDPSMLREHAAAWVYAQLGVPAPRHGYARVTVDSEPFGLYGVVEPVDQHFVDRHWGDDRDGWLYDSLWDLADFSPSAQGYFEVQEEGTDGAPFDDLHALVRTVTATPPADALDFFEAHFDADEFLRGQAAEIVLGNYDSYWNNRNNYLAYHAPLADQWHLVPWGQDQALTGNGSVTGPYVGVLDALCGAGSACAGRLRTELRDAAVALGDIGLDAYLEDTWALIRSDCVRDPRRELPCDPTSVIAFARARPDTVGDELGR
jgi:spore coat protein CotH